MSDAPKTCPTCGGPLGEKAGASAQPAKQCPARKPAIWLFWALVIVVYWVAFQPAAFVGSWRFRDTGDVLTMRWNGSGVLVHNTPAVVAGRPAPARVDIRYQRPKDDEFAFFPEGDRLGKCAIAVSPDKKVLTMTTKPDGDAPPAVYVLDRI